MASVEASFEPFALSAGVLSPGPVDLGEETLETGSVSSLGYLAAVNVVVWVGLFLYLWRLDRRIEETERRR